MCSLLQKTSSRKVPECCRTAGRWSEAADSAPGESSPEDDGDVLGGRTVGGAFEMTPGVCVLILQVGHFLHTLFHTVVLQLRLSWEQQVHKSHSNWWDSSCVLCRTSHVYHPFMKPGELMVSVVSGRFVCSRVAACSHWEKILGAFWWGGDGRMHLCGLKHFITSGVFCNQWWELVFMQRWTVGTWAVSQAGNKPPYWFWTNVTESSDSLRSSSSQVQFDLLIKRLRWFIDHLTVHVLFWQSCDTNNTKNSLDSSLIIILLFLSKDWKYNKIFSSDIWQGRPKKEITPSFPPARPRNGNNSNNYNNTLLTIQKYCTQSWFENQWGSERREKLGLRPSLCRRDRSSTASPSLCQIILCLNTNLIYKYEK